MTTNHIFNLLTEKQGKKIYVSEAIIFLKKITLNLMEFFSSLEPALTCSRLTAETIEQGVKYVQN